MEDFAPGYRLSHPPSGEEVFITGLSGRFPESDSVEELKNNLFNKVDLISEDDRRWKFDHSEIPHRTGKINNLEKFDASFFDIPFKEAHTMDPMGRILLEKTYEAIIDSGTNPKQLRNTKTGVFIGVCLSESEKKLFYEKMQSNGLGIMGTSHAMLANQISRWLNVTGPSYAVDNACSSALFAMDHAYRAIRDGECDSAIVGACNLCLHPQVSLQFYRLGPLSDDGKCKSFDNNASGYARSEAVVVCFLQKAKDSKRVYAQILHSKTNCDGYKPEGITFPSSHMQQTLLNEVYEECSINPTSVEFVEAHGTGTRVGDPAELEALDKVFCTGRFAPLLVGSLKTNMGHSEPAAGLSSIAKMCIAYHTGFIPPNLHYNTPREGVTALTEGRIKVVTDKTSWNRGLSGVNSFGFGGANSHVLLKNVAKQKVNNGRPSDDLPRLVCVSGRTKSSVARILDDLESRTVDAEEIGLLHSIYDDNIDSHPVRGYTLLGSRPNSSVPLSRDIKSSTETRRPIVFVYFGIEPQMLEIGSQLLKIPIFAASIQTSHNTLQQNGLNIFEIVANLNKSYKNRNFLHYVVGISAIQIALTDLLRALAIYPDHVMGYGIGEFASAYASGSLTNTEAIISAYQEGKTFQDSLSKKELMNFINQSQILDDIEGQLSVVQENTVILDITSHAELKTIIKKSPSLSKNLLYLELLNRVNDSNLISLFTTIGNLYVAGINLQLTHVYPKIQFPVSQGTPMLSHLVEWEHSEDWFLSKFVTNHKIKSGERTVRISLTDEAYQYLSGHVVGDRNVYPGMGYLVLVWETLGMMTGELYTELGVVFEDVCFLRATTIPSDTYVEFTISIHRGSGNFELTENKTTIVTGRVYAKKNVCQDLQKFKPPSKLTSSEAAMPMKSKDVYKELRLRGYQFRGLFRAITRCNLETTTGYAKWNNNWVTFLDSMLQIGIFMNKTRSFCVPTRIAKISIDPIMHYEAVIKIKQKGFMPILPVRVLEARNIISSRGIEILNVITSVVARKTPSGKPVVEKNVFIPNFSENEFKMEEIIRSNIQLILENIQTFKVKVVEQIDMENKKNNFTSVLETVADVLRDIPLVQAELSIISEENLKIRSDIIVEKKNLNGLSDCVLFIGAGLMQRTEILQQAFLTLRDKCFVMSREKDEPQIRNYNGDYDIIAIHKTGLEYITLLRKRFETKLPRFVKIITSDFGWITELKEIIQNNQKFVLYNQGESANGLLGLVNCLRKEPGGENVHGLLISDASAPAFDPSLDFYREQLDKNLTINVFKDGQWGTYRHLLLDNQESILADHGFVLVKTIGDLSSMQWVEGPLRITNKLKNPNNLLIQVYCAAVNFLDVMSGTGRVAVDAITQDRLLMECIHGIEVVGRLLNGSRVMAITDSCGISNISQADKALICSIPDEWTFEEAATIPVAYSTVYYALVMIGKIQPGESILIHAGSGGVGQAAINVALHHGLEVFTTVSTSEKREFVKKLFPQVKDSHIGNSRDTSFEDMILRETNGKGVNLVLNSLSDDKLQVSLRCLAPLGRFLELGKVDIVKNTLIDVDFLKKGIAFHGIMLDYISKRSEVFKLRLQKLMIEGILSGAIRPLSHCTFNKDEVEQAYRYMAAGKHMGKIVIKIRDEEKKLPAELEPFRLNVFPRYTCNNEHVSIIIGGLGGFGLELADWLILRGAKKLVLVSRRGISNGYQATRIRIWEGYGADVRISTHDVASARGCKEMLEMANEMGPVEAVFNLAVVLKDAVFQNQTPDTFKSSFIPKAETTVHLDKLSRAMCPDLGYFVVFSSVSCGRGNAGQTNYGMSNSVMERICEERKREGLPALAIQWGAIGDVGLVADMLDEDHQLEIGGTLQQGICSCLSTLDRLLKQHEPVVSSIVVAEKKATGLTCGSAADAVALILGVKDIKTISQQVSLAELGMDSMMAVEITQTLEREFGIFLTAQETRNLTFSRLLELSSAGKEVSTQSPSNKSPVVEGTAGLNILIRNLGDERMASQPIIYLPTLVNNSGADTLKDTKTIFMLPGIEGLASILEPLCRRLKARACVLQLGYDHQDQSQEGMVNRLYLIMKELLSPGEHFILLGYSFGSLLILHLAAKLERDGYKGTLLCIDGAPKYMYNMIKMSMNINNDKELQNSLICHIINIAFRNYEITKTFMDNLNAVTSFEDKIRIAFKRSLISEKFTNDFIITMATVIYNRIKVIINFDESQIKQLQSRIVLIRHDDGGDLGRMEENFGLDKLTKQNVAVHKVNGNHVTIIENEDVPNIINEIIKFM